MRAEAAPHEDGFMSTNFSGGEDIEAGVQRRLRFAGR